ncbi:MAG: hypothetical protein E6Q40_11710 [Cupriavidus sp.]|nr:MAG: hypothetical protein E6Q40_11710 [Cupriavidus sp.]
MNQHDFPLLQASPADIGLTSRALMQVLLDRGVSHKEASRIALAHANDVGERIPGREALYVDLEVDTTDAGTNGLTTTEQLQLYWLDLLTVLNRQRAEREALRSMHRGLGSMAVVPTIDLAEVQREVVSQLRQEMAARAAMNCNLPAGTADDLGNVASAAAPVGLETAVYSPAEEWRRIEQALVAESARLTQTH